MGTSPSKPCTINPLRIDCAVRHRRCAGCPHNKFFKPEKPTEPNIDTKSK